MADMKMQKVTPVSSPELDATFDEKLDLFGVWVARHRNAVLLIVVIAALIGAALVLWNQQRDGTLVAANNKFSEAEDAYMRALNETNYGTPERLEKMQAVAAICDEVAATYSTLPIGRSALLIKGNALFFAGDQIGSTTNTDKATAAFEEFLRRAENPMERAVGQLSLGTAQENRFFLTQDAAAATAAMDAYQKLEAMEDAGFLRYEAMSSRARVLAFQGKKDEAIALYRKVYDARYEPPKEEAKESTGRPEDMMVRQILQGSRSFTLGSSAREELLKLGVDLEKEEAARKK